MVLGPELDEGSRVINPASSVNVSLNLNLNIMLLNLHVYARGLAGVFGTFDLQRAALRLHDRSNFVGGLSAFT